MDELKACPFCGDNFDSTTSVRNTYIFKHPVNGCAMGGLEFPVCWWQGRAIDPRILLFIRQMKLLSSAYHGCPNGADDCLCEFELLFPELKEAEND